MYSWLPYELLIDSPPNAGPINWPGPQCFRATEEIHPWQHIDGYFQSGYRDSERFVTDRRRKVRDRQIQRGIRRSLSNSFTFISPALYCFDQRDQRPGSQAYRVLFRRESYSSRFCCRSPHHGWQGMPPFFPLALTHMFMSREFHLSGALTHIFVREGGGLVGVHPPTVSAPKYLAECTLAHPCSHTWLLW